MATGIMGPFILAWLVGEGIIVYRTWRQMPGAGPTGHDIWNPGAGEGPAKYKFIPPSPGQLAVASGVFIMLALLAEAPKARPLAIWLAWGFDIAAYMRLFDRAIPDPKRGPWPPPTAPDTVIIPNPSHNKDTPVKPNSLTTPNGGGMVTI